MKQIRLLAFLVITAALAGCPPRIITTPAITQLQIMRADTELNGRSIALIPPSDMWVPRPGRTTRGFPNDQTFQKHYTLNLPSAVLKMVDGQPQHLIELRGWLSNIDPEANSANEGWRDWSYSLDVDPEWLDAKGIDPNQLIKVGNVINPTMLMNVATSLPIKIELNGWDLDGTVPAGRPVIPAFRDAPPTGWTIFPTSNTPHVFWPYDPRHPLSWQPALAVGQYVRIFGALVIDEPHAFSGDIFGGRDAQRIWQFPFIDSWHPANPARFTEIHSPDIISVLYADGAKPMKEGVRVAVVCSDLGVNIIDFDITPDEPKPSPTSRLQVTEQVSPESVMSSIIVGKPAASGVGFSGAIITGTGDSRHVHLEITARLGQVGKFKAIYRAKWI
jgi:hypothetical protein